MLAALKNEDYLKLRKRNNKEKKQNTGVAKKLYHYLKSEQDRTLHIDQRRYGRAFLSEILEHFMVFAFKHPSVFGLLSIAVFDVDNMSRINKFHGIGAGEIVLRKLAEICKESPNRLISGRMGDDTVFIIYKDIALTEVRKSLHQILSDFQAYSWESISPGLHATCSAGYARFYKNEAVDNTVFRAVDGMLTAKRTTTGSFRTSQHGLKNSPSNTEKALWNEFIDDEYEDSTYRWLRFVS